MSELTKILSVHALRRVARARERQIQKALNDRAATGRPLPGQLDDVPDWARGVRVERAGLFQHAVVATENRGR